MKPNIKPPTLLSSVKEGWEARDQPGKFQWLPKRSLVVDKTYQRHASMKKVKQLAEDWSWIGCGVICAVNRGGIYYVLDGQHRVLAANRIPAVKDLPCMVFECADVVEEAQGFLDANHNRRALDGFDKFNAMLVMGDNRAKAVKTLLDKHKLTLQKIKAGEGREIKCIATLLNYAYAQEELDLALGLCVRLNPDTPILRSLLAGLTYLFINVTGEPDFNELTDRILTVGRLKLNEATHLAAMYYGKGKDRIWAQGILTEVNKIGRRKYALSTMVKD